MDEPFGALDALTRAKLQDELLEIVARTHSTVVMVTHDVDEAVLLSDKIVMMTNGPAATIGEVLYRCRAAQPGGTGRRCPLPKLPQGGDRLSLHAPGSRGKSGLSLFSQLHGALGRHVCLHSNKAAMHKSSACRRME
jgi:energy-coupling factor transporter ATP-binding protein EcfA2